MLDAENGAESGMGVDILLVDVECLRVMMPLVERVEEIAYEEMVPEAIRHEEVEDEAVRSDGSDSGLGSEPSTHVLLAPVRPIARKC